ncbi:YggT family protein [uncultured Thiothrix sp.]|jgi:YggT family protein|uniref:YggT family protein n=1 Tax=uncultured Thiothrix sp. TaxID=223185 RepID=UPI0026191F27|nr:YggT family protein [uncultured Thiothrix sp.]HMT94555.1 YggT family protein [Thiolinea sp.]
MVFQNIAVFLISTLFSLYIGAVLLRFLLALVRADFYNPLSQFLVKITNPVLVPLRRFIPPVGKIDSASLVLAFTLKLIAATLLMSIQGLDAGVGGLLLAVLADLIRTVVWIFMVALIIQAIMSWVGNSYGNPLGSLLDSLTAPILDPIRKFVPLIGMVDLSPLVAILLLQVVLIGLGGFPNI